MRAMLLSVELGVVIGKDGSDILKSQADSFVAGYGSQTLSLCMLNVSNDPSFL